MFADASVFSAPSAASASAASTSFTGRCHLDCEWLRSRPTLVARTRQISSKYGSPFAFFRGLSGLKL